MQVNISDAADRLGVQGPACSQAGAAVERLAGDLAVRKLGGQRKQHLASRSGWYGCSQSQLMVNILFYFTEILLQ